MADWRLKTKTFYGWWLVAATFVILLIAGGIGFYVFPVFIGPLQEQFGWNMTQISGAAGIFAIVFGLSGPLVGALIARFGVRRTMLTATALGALACLGLAGLVNLSMLYALCLFTGFATTGATLVPAQTLVTNWFDKYRGRAMALTMMGIGFGGFLLPSLNEFLIRAWGWRLAWIFDGGLIALVGIPLTAVFVRTKPSDVGLVPDGAATTERTGEATTTVRSGLPVGRAVRTGAFSLLVAIYLLQLIGQSALNFHFVPFAIQEGGFAPQRAAFLFGLALGVSIVGRLLFGCLADRQNPAMVMAAAAVLGAIGPLSLVLFIIRAGMNSPYLLLLHALPYGLGFGGQVVLLPVLVGRCFGRLHFSKIQGLVVSGFAAGVLLGVPLAGWTFDRFGSYEVAFFGAAAVFVISAVGSLLVRPDRYRTQFVAAD